MLTGGSDVFSAGFDLDEIGQGVDDLEVDLVIEETVAAIRQLPIPVIAAIEGACVGAALEIIDRAVAGRATRVPITV